MNYDKLLEFIWGIYKVPKSHLDQLQGLFVRTLAVAIVPVFAGFCLSLMLPEELLGSMTNLVVGLLYLLGFMLTIPYQLDVIRLCMKKAEPAPFFRSLLSDSTIRYVTLLMAMLGAGAIAFLPYGVAEMLIVQGSNSNILSSFKYLFLIVAIVSVFYMFAKTFGIIASGVAEKDVSIGQMFANTKGHFLALAVILATTLLPLELVSHLITGSLSGLMEMGDSIVLDGIVMAFEAFVRTAVLLMQLYLLWRASTEYMMRNDLV